jgi:hypothetical protein
MAAKPVLSEVMIIQIIGMTVKPKTRTRNSRPAQRHQST